MAETQRDLAEYQSDHDLIVILNERVGTLIVAVNKKNEDHEMRIRLVERAIASLNTIVKVWGSIALALLGLGEVLLQIFRH